MNKILYVFVEDFSSNEKEAFFEKELPYLCDAFEKVYVLSIYPWNNKTLNYSSRNLEILEFDYFAATNRIKVFLANFFQIIKIFLFEITRTHNKIFYIKNAEKVLNQLLITFSAAHNLRELIKKDINNNTVFYSFWFKQWTAALSIIKSKERDLKLVSRIHGGDYDEDQIKTILPFRYFQLKMVNKIIAVSDFGKNYLIKKFSLDPSKVVTSRLGLDIEPVLNPINKNELIIVSCSSVIALKRVELIVEILKYIRSPYKWVHFGGGDLSEDLKKKAALLKDRVELKGYVPNKEFLEYLGKNPVSLFINVSESEGIPVSMMEAISHGIPLAGTSVCGVPEIINGSTGILFSVDFNPKNVAQTIEEMHIQKKLYSSDFRSGIMNFYKESFFVDKNHKYLAELLVKL